MGEQALLALLRELVVDSQWVKYPVIASVEGYYTQGIELPDQGIKNPFLRNHKGTRHYLVLLDKYKEADLPDITEQIGESRLSFASVERLREYLGVELGCVTPFTLVNDPRHKVEMLLDDTIHQDQLLGFYPLVNTATECIRYTDLLVFLAHMRHEPYLIRVQVAASHLLAPVSLGEVVPAVAQQAGLEGPAPGLGFQPQAGAFPARLAQAADPRQAQVAADLRLFRRASTTKHPTLDLNEVDRMIQRIVVGESAAVVGQFEAEAELLEPAQVRFLAQTALARFFHLLESKESHHRLPGQSS